MQMIDGLMAARITRRPRNTSHVPSIMRNALAGDIGGAESEGLAGTKLQRCAGGIAKADASRPRREVKADALHPVRDER
jgi:hypothetical protein